MISPDPIACASPEITISASPSRHISSASNGVVCSLSPSPASKAKTVTVKNGKPFVTDGPYAETREQLGGYTLLEAKDANEAVEVAAGFFGPSDNKLKVHIEVRPVVAYELPS